MKTNPLPLAGDARHQEANRKRILHELRLFERQSNARAQKASELANALAVCDLATIASGERSTRKLLSNAFELDCCDCGSGAAGEGIRALVGADDDYVADQVLRKGRTLAEVNREREQWQSKSQEADT